MIDTAYIIAYIILWAGIAIGFTILITVATDALCKTIRNGFDKLEDAIWRLENHLSPLKPDTHPNHLKDYLTAWEIVRRRNND